MKYITYILTICLWLVSGCNTVDSGTNSTSRLLPEPDIRERLKNQKRIIDTLFNHNKENLIVLVKLVGNDELVTVTNENFPKNIETTFNILKDSIGQVVTISEYPFSESGDWNIILSYYFDKDGKTFAFERQTNYFNSICTDGVAFETKTEYYDSDFKMIDKEYKLVDKENKPLQKDSCQFPYDHSYKALTNIDKYLQSHKIKNGR